MSTHKGVAGTPSDSAPSGSTPCTHCGLPVPAGLVEPDSELQFCCGGCRLVYQVIHRHGLEHYYDLVPESEETPRPARPTTKSYEEYDDPAFHDLYVRASSEGLHSVDLYLEGVHCSACLWLVERVPLVMPGVAESQLDLGRSMARVTWDPEAVSLSHIARLLDSLGYPVHPFRGVEIREMRRREDRSMLIRITVAGACAANVMMLAVALYSGMFHGMASEFESFFRWISLLLSVPAVFWSGSVFFKGTWGSLRARALHMDVPISLGILAGFGWGAWNTIRGAGEIYFDSVTALIFLLLVGRYLQQRRQRAAADAAELLFSLSPSSARIVEDDATRMVPVEAVLPEMTVRVLAGESLPVDGTVTMGRSMADLSLLTGESRPAPVAPGERVHAGTVNLASPLDVRVDAAGERTRVGRLMRLVEEHSRRRAPVVRLADRISGVFVAVVLGLAALTAGLWWWMDASRALDHTIALLIVTCPCALGLATPLAVSAAIGRASRAGILIKGGDALERLSRPGQVFLDKTGTLTEGRTALVRWWGDRAIQPWVAAIESQVAHPVARAMVDALDDDGSLPPAQVRRVDEGAGVEGQVLGHSVAVGSPAWVRAHTREMPAEAEGEVGSLVGEGLTPVMVAVDGRVEAVAGFGDPIREDAAETVAAIRARGWRVGILSGDHPQVVEAVGRRLGLDAGDCRGGVVPEEKLRVVERAASRGAVVMVGDGINDAAALSAATVGVAVHGGAEVALKVADAFLTRPGLDPVARLLDGARRTMRVIRWNLAFSLFYNVAGAGLAMVGLIHPLVAAVLMPLSSVTVITHSYRARTF